MNDNNPGNNISNEIIQECFRQNDITSRIALTAILSACRVLKNDTSPKQRHKKECLDTIESMCALMMKSIETASHYVSDIPVNVRSFDLKTHLERFAAKCSEALGKTVRIKFSGAGKDPLMVAYDADLLDFVLLSSIRASVLSGSSKITLEMLEEKGYAAVRIMPPPADSGEVFTEAPELTSEARCSLLGKAAADGGGTYSETSDYSELRMKLPEGGELELSAPEETVRGMFDLPFVMLGDIGWRNKQSSDNKDTGAEKC